MNFLKDIIEKIQEKTAEANIDVKASAPGVRAGVEAIARNAREEIVMLNQQYRTAVASRVLLVEVVGEHAGEFAKIARSGKRQVPAYNYLEVADEIVAVLRTQTRNDSFTSNESLFFQTKVLELKALLGIQQMPPLKINEVQPTVYYQPIQEAVERSLEASYGNGLYDAYTLRSAQEEALKNEFIGNVMPILVYNFKAIDPDSRLLPPTFFVIDASQPVTRAYVQEQLNRVKELLLNNKKTEQTDGVVND
jgi:hypothetical protein